MLQVEDDRSGHNNRTQNVVAVSQLGCRHAQVFLGNRHDRYRRDAGWHDQLTGAQDVLERLVPTLRDHGVATTIETHAVAASTEIQSSLDAFNSEIAGVIIDSGNLIMRLEDSVSVVKTLVSRVLAVHIKETVLAFTHRGSAGKPRR